MHKEEKWEPKTVKELGFGKCELKYTLTDDKLKNAKIDANYDHYIWLYNNNKDCKIFIDRICKSYGYSLDFCLTIQTVRDVCDYYAKKQEDVVTVAVDICECDLTEDKSC